MSTVKVVTNIKIYVDDKLIKDTTDVTESKTVKPEIKKVMKKNLFTRTDSNTDNTKKRRIQGARDPRYRR